MNEIENKEELIKDLQFIKEAAKKNNSILKYVSLSEGIKVTALLTGLLIFVFGVAILWLEKYYGNYAAIPTNLKNILYILIALSSVGLILTKVSGILKVLKRYRKDMNIVKLFSEVYTQKFWILSLTFFISIIVYIIFFSLSGLTYLIVPVLSIQTSMLFITLQSVLNIKEMAVPCGWIFSSGLVFLFFAADINPLIILISTFGIGMIILYISVQITSKKEKRGKSDRE